VFFFIFKHAKLNRFFLSHVALLTSFIALFSCILTVLEWFFFGFLYINYFGNTFFITEQYR